MARWGKGDNTLSIAENRSAQLIAAGEELTGYGIPVLPIHPGAKPPIPDESTGSWRILHDPDDVRAVFLAHPDANLGMLCGRAKNSPVLVVDIDGPSGLAKARELGVSSRWLATGEGAMLEPDYTRHSECFQNSVFDPILMRAVIANGVRLASQDQFIANEVFAEKLIVAYQDAQENLESGLFEDFADAAFAATKAQFKTFPH